MHQADNNLPPIDAHPTKILSTCTKQSPKANVASEPAQNTHSANAVYHPVLGSYLEFRELLKTSEKKCGRTPSRMSWDFYCRGES